MTRSSTGSPTGRIWLVTVPGGKASDRPLQLVVELLRGCFADVEVVALGHRPDLDAPVTCFMAARSKGGGRAMRRIGRYLRGQIRMARHLRQRVACDDHVLFYLGADTLLIPMAAARSRTRRLGMMLSSEPGYVLTASGRVLRSVPTLLFYGTRRLSRRIFVYTERLARHPLLRPAVAKVRVADIHAVDERFRPERPFDERPRAVAYVGRFSHEKGFDRLVGAIEASASADPPQFVVVGDGPLAHRLDGLSAAAQMHVTAPGWVDRGVLPKTLNAVRLLVMPSRTEGLPNVLLEAMACGTPALATPVGAVPDIIEHGHDGLLADASTGAALAREIAAALDRDDLPRIARQAHENVMRRHAPEAVREAFHAAMQEWRGA